MKYITVLEKDYIELEKKAKLSNEDIQRLADTERIDYLLNVIPDKAKVLAHHMESIRMTVDQINKWNNSLNWFVLLFVPKTIKVKKPMFGLWASVEEEKADTDITTLRIDIRKDIRNIVDEIINKKP